MTDMKSEPYPLKPITIGHTIYAFKDGGMERGLLNLVNYGNWNRFHHVILCLTEAGAFAEQLRSPSCTIVELRKKEGNDLFLPFRIANVVRQRRIDILHARGWPTLVETAIASRLARVRRTVYGFHGKTIADLQGISLRRQWVQKSVVRWYQRVVTLNPQMRYDLAMEYGLSKDHIHIIANGVDVDLFRPRENRAQLRKQLRLPVDRFIVGNVARLDPVKNHEVILRALYRLRGNPDSPFFLLVGDGYHRAVVEREVELLRLAADVRFFGYSDCIPELLNCMDVYVQSSFYEGFSNTLLEAMACGLPVLATDVGGTKDLLPENHWEYLFQPEDDRTLASLLLRLQQDSALRDTLARQERRHVVGTFSVQTMVAQYEDMYAQLTTMTRGPEARSQARV